MRFAVQVIGICAFLWKGLLRLLEEKLQMYCTKRMLWYLMAYNKQFHKKRVCLIQMTAQMFNEIAKATKCYIHTKRIKHYPRYIFRNLRPEICEPTVAYVTYGRDKVHNCDFCSSFADRIHKQLSFGRMVSDTHFRLSQGRPIVV